MRMNKVEHVQRSHPLLAPPANIVCGCFKSNYQLGLPKYCPLSNLFIASLIHLPPLPSHFADRRLF